MLLDGVPCGARCRIKGVQSASSRALRLMEMGLIEGTEVQVVRRAPFGDPMQLRVGDYDLSLRSSEAALIDVAAL